MEKISEILNNIKERISNPLIFSFICSWLIINWQITVGLIWYDTKQIENEGCVSIFQFIKEKINTTDSLWHPLFFSVAYTILIPIIRNLIRAFYSWSSKWGDNWNLKIIDRGQISINKYLKLRTEHEKRTKILEDVISKESAYLDNFNSLNTELLEVKNSLNETTQRLNSSETYVRQLHDYSIINGTWQNNYELENGEKGTETIYIDNSKYSVVSQFGEKEHIFDIRNFYYDNRNENVFFVKELVGEEKRNRNKAEHYNINRLKFEGTDLLVGTENGTTKIQYRRK